MNDNRPAFSPFWFWFGIFFGVGVFNGSIAGLVALRWFWVTFSL